MMYLQLIISSVLINFIDAGDIHFSSKDATGNQALLGSNGRMKLPGYQLWNQHHWRPHKGETPFNITYIDKAENMIRLPTMKNYYEEKKNKKKTFKKSPKRTIQKIIKKNNKSKIKKLYVVKMSSKTTVIPKYDAVVDDEYSSRNAEMTTRPNQQKKMKKYSGKLVKIPRYPMPYKQMQRKSNFKRSKRETQSMFLFRDFDSMQVLDKGKKDKDDYNVVNAHIKNYW